MVKQKALKKATKSNKVSKVKLANQKANKKVRPGKILSRQAKKEARKSLLASGAKAKKVPSKKGQQTPTVEEHNEEDEFEQGADLLSMVEDDDLEFIKKSVTDRSYQLFKQIRSSADQGSGKGPRKKKRRNEEEEEEDELENEFAETIVSAPKQKQLLPIKTSHGLVIRQVDCDDADEVPEKAGRPAKQAKKVETPEIEKESDDELDFTLNEVDEIDPLQPITTAQLLARREAILNKRKFHIGVLCSGIIENPEQKLINFTPLLEMMEETHPEVKISVRKLVAVSLLEVFKDVLPSYYIRHIEIEKVQLKKVTIALRKFEQDLLAAYKKYLTKLEALSSCLIRKKGDTRKSSEQEIQLGVVSVKCMAELLVAHPYFNFSNNLAYFLVTFLDNSNSAVRDIARDAIKRVFKEDKRGDISLEIVKRINGLVKRREHNAHPHVLEVLLSLRIKDINLDKEKEDDLQQKKLKGRKMKILTMSRTERKREKMLKEVNRELMETEAEENKQKKQQAFTEVVKVVFMIYFRILKQEYNSKLLSVCLEGLAKFSHCINLEYYHDLVNCMNELMESGDLGYREQLHIVQTVFTILSGQGEMLTIDPIRFYTHLYRNMLQIHAGKTHSDISILARTVEVMLIKRRKKVSHQRVLAFTKRLATLSLHLLHNGSLSCLGHIKNVIQLNKFADVLLDLDLSGGQGLYDPMLEEPEYCNASSSSLWEVALLQRHYHPHVRKYSHFIASGAPPTGAGSLPLDLAKLTADDLLFQYDGSSVAFNPAIPPPKKVIAKQKASKHYISIASLDEEVKRVMESPDKVVNFYSAMTKHR
ncbi:nucleolar complex protein 3 homolog [Thrips palmi]|uniref:Nucleolar complex protein 3 homolog n=1 Tax=Thrips palmi TaxID=161013 RepID=A0A6P9A150_THRPL|nr:nucleolar complex protein 3 homolog [Thrips palmi]